MHLRQLQVRTQGRLPQNQTQEPLEKLVRGVLGFDRLAEGEAVEGTRDAVFPAVLTAQAVVLAAG